MINSLWNISTSIKNSQICQTLYIRQPKTKLTIIFLNILWDSGFILGYKIDNLDSNILKIFLKYRNGDPVINSVKFIFKPSRHIYYSASQLWNFDSKKSLIILTTSKGLMTAQECKKTQTGGQPLFLIR